MGVFFPNWKDIFSQLEKNSLVMADNSAALYWCNLLVLIFNCRSSEGLF